ncbi:hypothetical protein BU17DRAFT_53890 [Hysterangium stoloniferum]|nr:hypothetical protein BU17DRAFT_53890 [Hysterangium stoloniferum]
MRTVLRIDNLHCQSCVANIHACFSMLNAADGLDVSLVDHTVSFDFPDVAAVLKQLDERGFDVASIASTRPQRFRSFLASIRRRAISRHEDQHKKTCDACRNEMSPEEEKSTNNEGEIHESRFTLEGLTCSACTSTLNSLLRPMPGVQSSHVTLVPPSATIQHNPTMSVSTIIQSIEDAGFGAELISSNPLQTYRVVLAIQGMTCASCVSAITRAIESVPGIADITINLLGSSGNAVVQSRADAERVRSEIEDAGFDCSIVEIIPLIGKRKLKSSIREVTISAEGEIDEYALTATLSSLPFQVSHTQSLGSSPATFTLTYVPQPPTQTLRTILDLLKYSHPSVTFTPLPPRSLSSSSQKTSYHILYLFLITLLFAIPTFVVAVVGTSLLPETNSFRMSLEKPVWGDATLATVILWGLATPIQFGVGIYFYKGAAKSLWNVWRPPSTSWLNRLIRWGSMDTLVSLGTLTGYLASLVLLGLDVSGKRTENSGVGGMGWFDSSVFLMLFILLGRHLDHLTRQRTTNVLSDLSGSVPEGGLLVSYSSLTTTPASASDIEPLDDPLTATTTLHIPTPLFEISDIVLIPPGASPPLDCILIAPPTSSQVTPVDASRPLTHFIQASLTGEHSPVPKFDGDPIYAGTVNAGNSAVLARVDCLEGDRVVDGIVNMVLGGGGGKGRDGGVERIAENITSFFVPIVVGIACIVLAAWCFRGIPTSLGNTGVEMTAGNRVLFAVQFAVAVLVVACPCGIGLAVPTAQIVGIGLGAQYGIVSNGGSDAFFALGNLNVLVMDKTGTITRGKFTVSDNRLLISHSSIVDARTLILSLLRSAEFASTHPVAVGIREWCDSQLQLDTDQNDATNVELVSSEEIPGRGLIATLRISAAATDLEVCIGNENLMQDVHAEYASPVLAEQSSGDLRSWQIGGKSVVLLSVKLLSGSSCNLPIKAKRHTILALLGVHDPPRAEASTLITELRKLNIDVWMISGDNEVTAKTIAQSVGIESTHVIAGALPADKQSWVERLQNGEDISLPESSASPARKRKTVAFVGDGINDAPALSQADISIAMGSGSSLALSTASFSLIRSDLLSILTIHHLARATRHKIISNFVWACLYNVALIPLAAGAFYGVSGKKTDLPPVWASAAMALSSISVVVNSLALRWTYKEPAIVRKYRSEA